MDVTALDGRGYARFLAAGSYFLRKYREVLNDLNVYPVPDGDTGTNMFLTLRSAAIEAYAGRAAPLCDVAAAAAQGALMGARGNSGVILSQMLRGFAHHVRHRTEIGTFVLATALREAAGAARQALLKPVEGTIISVADAAADAAYRLALHEDDLVRVLAAVLRAANEALERTPLQLPALAEAGVVDAGGAGFVYLLEGALAFLPEVRMRATAFPRRPDRARVFNAKQSVGEARYCTEFVVEHTTCTAPELRQALEPRSESLLVIGAPPTIRVHVHTDDPERVKAVAARHGSLTRVKVDDMERQHQLLLVDRPAAMRSIVAVVPGPGFEAIAKELGAETTVSGVENPSVKDLLLALNKCLTDRVDLLANDSNVVLAAREAAKLCKKDVRVIPTRDIVEGIAVLLAMGGDAQPSDEELQAVLSRTRSAQLFFAAKDVTLGGVSVTRGKPVALFGGMLFTGETLGKATEAVVSAMRQGKRGLITLYYGGAQREKDAQRSSEEVRTAFPGMDVEYYYGGMKNAEYWIAFDE
ncbi:MAG TPA: DAK2 domain-containing protein [Candidatus Tyrphobacter sp.]